MEYKIVKNELSHHGIMGQKWGTRNGPPYPLGGGDYSAREKREIYKRRKQPNSIYNKKHFDEVLGKGSQLSTLSYDKDRTKGADMFYATHKKLDQHQYNALFNRPVPQTLYDSQGHAVGTGMFLKYKIKNDVTKDLKIASEDSGADAFMSLYKKDRDFYNFVTDPKRMKEHFVDDKYKFKGYRESRDVLQKMQNKNYKPTADDLQTVYRMFNYVIPSDGGGDARAGKDVATQRAKFFNELKKNGYGAVLDTNDAIYGGFKATSPVIVFDMDSVALAGAERTTVRSKQFSKVALVGRKALGV